MNIGKHALIFFIVNTLGIVIWILLHIEYFHFIVKVHYLNMHLP